MRFLILLFLFTNLFSQQTKLEDVFSDCEKAREIILSGSRVVGKTIAPNGSGITNEISSDQGKDAIVFAKEHNTAWYKLKMATEGKLVFDIIPTKPTDDYDFVIYKADNENFCATFHQNMAKPLRSCISRDKSDLKGRTGLNLTSQKENIQEGIGDAYAKYIQVKKGEVYYLVLDNVYRNGGGHTIKFGFAESVKVEGRVQDENKTPIEAEITVTDQWGDTMFVKKTSKDGQYMFLIPVKQDMNYNMNFYDYNSFFYSQNFRAGDTNDLKNLAIVLPKLKKGRKQSVGSMNFYPGEATYLPQALPSFTNLYKLMKKNPKLKIMIIGHSNGRDVKEETAAINFTKARATTIKNFLVKKGIDKNRIDIDGKADHEMLFPIDIATEKQQEMNRRVEILVLEY
jgi:outer membrane protein OmpA-like peptidoglycan-associated protein